MYNENYCRKDLELVIKIVQEKACINLSKYRSSFLKNCLENRRRVSNINNLKSYCDLLEKDENEISHLIAELNIQVSWFFRNEITWQLFRNIILPRIINDKIKRKEKIIRIWSAGCSTGEEPYSIAMLLMEELVRNKKKFSIQIFATDIQKSSLSFAKKGIYFEDSIVNVPFGLLTKYFDRKNRRFRIKTSVKNIVYLTEFDLLDKKHIAPPDAVYAEFDIVLCRNVLIYYNALSQKQIFNKLSRSVAKGGYLILGEAEEPVASYNSEYRNIFEYGNIYQKF